MTALPEQQDVAIQLRRRLDDLDDRCEALARRKFSVTERLVTARRQARLADRLHCAEVELQLDFRLKAREMALEAGLEEEKLALDVHLRLLEGRYESHLKVGLAQLFSQRSQAILDQDHAFVEAAEQRLDRAEATTQPALRDQHVQSIARHLEQWRRIQDLLADDQARSFERLVKRE